MDKITLTEFRKIFEKITVEISCPVCLNLLHAPVTVCENGHGTCPDCRAKITLCPVCNKSFQNIKVRPLDDILSIIPRKCKFEGCEELVRVTDNHEELCGYRATACETCAWTGCVKDIVDHVQTEFRQLKTSDGDKFGMMCVNFETPLVKSELVIPMFKYGQLFWLKFTNDLKDKDFRLTITCIPQIQFASVFYDVKLVLLKDQKQLKVITTMTVKNFMSNQDNFISLPFSTLRMLLSAENTLTYGVFIKENVLMK